MDSKSQTSLVLRHGRYLVVLKRLLLEFGLLIGVICEDGYSLEEIPLDPDLHALVKGLWVVFVREGEGVEKDLIIDF